MNHGGPEAGGPERLAVVTVNWRRPDLTVRCLDSLAAGGRKPDWTVVVENGSGDDSASIIRAAHPDAVLAELPENTGFTGGYNLGMRRALELGADLVMILNNDAEAERDTLSALVSAASAAPDAGLFGAVQSLPDGSEAGPFFYFRWSDGRVSTRRTWRAGSGGETFLSGCAIMARRGALERVGPFDERFFLYGEDVEWSMRARRRGVRMVAAPGARVRHELFASSGRTSSAFLFYDSRNRFFLGGYAPAMRRLGVYKAGVALRLVRKARRLAGLGNVPAAESVLDGCWAGLSRRTTGSMRCHAPRALVRLLLAGAHAMVA